MTTTSLVLPSTLIGLASEINDAHASVEGSIRNGLWFARRAGELLCRAKQLVPHGEWLPWLGRNVAFKERAARYYMSIAERWEELQTKSASDADLTFRDAVRLLTTPKEFRDLESASLPAPEPGANEDEDTSPPPSEIATDALGLPIPDRLLAAFAALPLWDEAARLVARLHPLITEIRDGPGGELFLRGTAANFLPHIRETLASHRPYAALCPACQTSPAIPPDQDCAFCFGRGWVTQALWDEAPADCREALLRFRLPSNLANPPD